MSFLVYNVDKMARNARSARNARNARNARDTRMVSVKPGSGDAAAHALQFIGSLIFLGLIFWGGVGAQYSHIPLPYAGNPYVSPAAQVASYNQQNAAYMETCPKSPPTNQTVRIQI